MNTEISSIYISRKKSTKRLYNSSSCLDETVTHTTLLHLIRWLVNKCPNCYHHESVGPYLTLGRTLNTDNLYTSIALNNTSLSHQTHIVGLRQSNRKRIQKLSYIRLQNGKIVAEYFDVNLGWFNTFNRRDGQYG